MENQWIGKNEKSLFSADSPFLPDHGLQMMLSFKFIGAFLLGVRFLLN